MDLTTVREKIDAIDKAIHELINKRAALAQHVAQIKISANPNAEFYRPEREAQILEKIKQNNQGPLTDQAIQHLFKEIISSCLALETTTKVAYLGPVGTYTQSAVEKHFGSFVETQAFITIEDVFREVELSDSAYGVVPVENSSEGVISNTLDQFINSSIKICGEIELAIHHNLISKCGDIKQIKRVYAHNQSLMQCKRWLDNNLSGALQIPVSSNAEAAKMARTAKDSAAIAGEVAAKVYQHNIIARNIETETRNTTRFLVIGNNAVAVSGADKTSILLTTANKSGALFSLLKPFSDHNISLTKIESRPSKRTNWDYLFFVDIEGHQTDPVIKNILFELKQANQLIAILGSYPKAV